MHVLTLKPQTTMDFNISEVVMTALRYGGASVASVFIGHWLLSKKQAKESAKEEVAELREQLNQYQEDNREEFFEIRLALNNLHNRIGDTVIYPKKLGRGGPNGLQ